MLRRAIRDIFKADWEQNRAVSSLPCTVAIALCLITGVVVGRPAAGIFAASGAMSVGFGSFQRLGRSRVRPMWWASIGMAVTTACGSLAGHSVIGLAINAATVGLLYGMMTAISGGTAWISLQCAIFGIVATGFPAAPRFVLERAILILGGGLLQLGLVLLFRSIHLGFAARVPGDRFPGYRSALKRLRANFKKRSPEFRYAIRLAIALFLSAMTAYWLGLPNGYWVPMTTLLVLRTDLHETLTRGLARMAGTLVGAGLATILLSTLRPGPAMLIVLVVIFAWLCYSVVMVSYGALSASVTAYIACLLALTGLPEKEVALHRVINTCLGGGSALAIYLLGAVRSRKAPLVHATG